MKLNGAQIIIGLLERQGVQIVSGIPGGTNLPLYDALGSSSIQHVLARHEQGAGFIAHGMARATGRTAVCFATSGPGATNLVTALADAKLDSVPVVAITGQVAHSLIGTDAFQEIDTFGMTLPIAKHNYLVESAADLLRVVPDAFRIAASGRPGPVLIDVPKDVQTATVEFESWPEPGRAEAMPLASSAQLDEITSLIRHSHRPIILAGGGVVASTGAYTMLRHLAERQLIPVTTTLMGLGAVPSGHQLFLGMLGMHAARFTNLALEECDLLLVLGARFDDRATGKVTEFCPHARVVHVDVDASELGKLRAPLLGICADAGQTLRALEGRLGLVSSHERLAREAWLERVRDLRCRHALHTPGVEDPSEPYGMIRHVARVIGGDAIITTDVGQHQMLVAQSFPVQRPRQLLTSGGLGTMGFGLPAAIGAALAEPDRTVVCFSGDGSLLMNVQELATLAEENLNVKVIVMNNEHLGLVRQQQELFYGGRLCASAFRAQPDFAAMAKAFGVQGYDLGEAVDPGSMLENVLRRPGPALVNAPVDYAQVVPMVPPGAPNRQMIGGELDRPMPTEGCQTLS